MISAHGIRDLHCSKWPEMGHWILWPWVMIHILPPRPSPLGAGSQGQYLGPPTKIRGNSAWKGWPLHSQFVTTTWLKNIAWKCTFIVFIDLRSDGLQLVGSKACLKDLTSIQANGICFIILNNKDISSINKEQKKCFPGSLLDPCV